MGYIVKDGDTLSGIAAANKVTVDQLVKWNSLAPAGKVLRIPVPTTTPPVVTPIGGTVNLSDTGPNGTVAANKIVQTALNREYGGVVIDGDFGPQTKAAYTKWQIACGYNVADGSADGVPGIASLTKLGAKYGFGVTNTVPPAPAVGDEPAANYTRVKVDGQTVNQRTKDMLDQAKKLSGVSFTLTQGSYNAGGVSASAGTHDGGGACDIASTSTVLLRALRQVGFAAWIRTPTEGFAYHTHCEAIGDKELSPSAKDQITSYYNGRDGLAKAGPDTAPVSVGRPYPAWAAKYGAPVK